MRPGQSSKTAAYVAFLRALGDRGFTSAEGFSDPIARALLPPRWARAFAWLAPILGMLPRALRALVLGRVDLLVVRSLAVDAEVTAALAPGVSQLVVLGAGFDSRAHRMTALGGVHVFEVDHPATQASKRLRAARLPRTCRAITYVGCDFEKDVLGERLQAAGHRADLPTIWTWEGVTLYLHDEAIHQTLRAIFASSAEKSRLVFEYHDAEARAVDPYYAFVRKFLLAFWSEPHIGARSQRTMHAELNAAGLHLERDFVLTEWGTTFARSAPSPMKGARIAVAVRRRI